MSFESEEFIGIMGWSVLVHRVVDRLALHWISISIHSVLEHKTKETVTMCAIIISLALCDSTCPYPKADVPAGCLKIYPFTSVEIRCPGSECVLGFCGRIEMLKNEGEDGRRIEKRVCESCVAWSALMRDEDGKKTKQNIKRDLSKSYEWQQEGLDSDRQQLIMTPGGSSNSSNFGVDVDNELTGEA